MGEPLALYEWQARFLGNHYLVKPDVVWEPDRPVLGPAFVHARSGMVGPQKLGKDPMEAAQVCLEGVGPALFAGWAGPDEGYVCKDHGCRCGWERPYEEGEPKGMPWPTPLIQITAVSEDATGNTYDALRPMIELGRLHDLIPKTSEEFIRLPNRGRIDVVTASAKSRLGQRITFASQGEAGLWTARNGMIAVADTQYRGLAGMSGRAVWHTNAWDPAAQSLAQREHKAAQKDVYIQFDRAESGLSFTRRDERFRIYRTVYPAEVRREKGGHLDLDSIDAEAMKLLGHDPSQAERFYGNKLVAGSGAAFDPARWDAIATTHTVPDGALITLGFDGSKSGDHTALVACEVETGHLWPLDVWDPAGGEVPVDAVNAAVDAAHARYRVARMYADPPYWRDELAAWQGRYGDKVVLKWETWRNRPMGFACRSFATAITDGSLSHDGDRRLALHVGACQRKPLAERDDKGVNLWTVQKSTPDSPDKIDAAVAAVLAWEARLDAIAAGLEPELRTITDDELLAYLS